MIDKSTKSPDPESESEALATPSLPRPARGGHKLGGSLAALFALLILVGAGYLWYTLSFKGRGLDTGAAAKTDLPTEVRTLRQDLNSMQESLRGVQDGQNALKQSMEKLFQDLGKSRGEWALEEVEQLLLLANDRLRLARDVDTAVTALKAADKRMAELANPALFGVRRLVADEIAVLGSVPKTDTTGLALRLNALANIVTKLPLAVQSQFHQAETAAPEPAAPRAETGWRQAAQEFWQDVLGLIRVQKVTEARAPLLAPEQQYFLRENLRLTLAGAQVALLRDDGKTFHANIANARKWLEDYFDVGADPVRNALAELRTMQQVIFTDDLPDISASLTALHKVKSAKAGS